jgi:ABC-type multidrug transport system fused ATPase/permease subunit
MDEATSALDNETEAEIVDEIKHLKGDKTLIVIAHRLSTVKHCDYIYRIDKGKIVEKGNYKTVIGEDE